MLGLKPLVVGLQFIFGYGVGGEYPMASSSAAERAEASKRLRFRRGEMVVCTFAMQVWPGTVIASAARLMRWMGLFGCVLL